MSRSPDTAAPHTAKSSPNLLHILAGAAALTLLAGGAGVFLAQQQISHLQARAAAKEAEVGTSEEIARRFQTTQATYDATKARARYLETSVSAKSYVPTLLEQLEALAGATHLTVAAVRPGPITVAGAAPGGAALATAGDGDTSAAKRTPRPPYDTMDISVDVSGSYSSTAAFLYGLTRFPKIVSVTSVQMRPNTAGQDGKPAGVATSLHLTAFVFHEAPQASMDTTAANAAVPYHPFSLPPVSKPSVPAAHALSNAAQERAQVGISTL